MKDRVVGFIVVGFFSSLIAAEWIYFGEASAGSATAAYLVYGLILFGAYKLAKHIYTKYWKDQTPKSAPDQKV